jgi:PTS system nitrogen regulatory IIA component
MRLTDYLNPALVVYDLRAADSRDLLVTISERICRQHPELNQRVLLSKLQEREEKSSSGLEGGVAVPHAMVPGVQKAICAVARLAEPIDLGAMDGSPVRIAFVLISSPQDIATHIRTLARIARLCSVPAFIEKMNQAKDAAGLYEIIHAEDNRHV